MPAQTPVWVGSTAITECPDSPQISVDANRFMVTRHYEGPWDAIVANQPVKDQTWQDMPAAVLITTVKLTPKPGGIGHLEVYGETPGTGNSTTPTYEVEWVETDIPIEQHPIFADGSYYGTSAGAWSLTLGDRAAVQAWEQEDDFTLKCQWQFKIPVNATTDPPTGYTALSGSGYPIAINGVPYNVYALSTNAQELAARKFRGQESYRLWCPVARQTIESFNLPTVNPCGVVENPPSAIGAPAGYVWQRSAQRATKSGRWGKWQQQQEWQGFQIIDTALYPSS